MDFDGSVQSIHATLKTTGLLETDNIRGPEKKKRKKVLKACVLCRKAHVSCDTFRPCLRCVKRGCGDSCTDIITNMASDDSLFSLNDNYFQLYHNNASLPMDDPNSLFSTVSFTSSLDDPVLPNCFSKLDMEDTATPLFHACRGRGLEGCIDCSFNIDNILPQPHLIEYESPIIPTINDHHTTAHLAPLLALLGIEIAISCHIIHMATKLINTQKPSTTSKLKEYTEFFGGTTLSTPTGVFSPSGLMHSSNLPFETYFKPCLNFCLYSVLDMASILQILDLTTKYENTGGFSFGRVSVRADEGGMRITRNCAVSLTTVRDAGLWIIIQFIPC